MSENAELIAKAVGGDVPALSELLALHAPQLRAQLRVDPRWQSVLDIDDVLQVTFLEAFLQIGRFVPAGGGAFHGWLSRIAENNLFDAIKGLERQKRPPPARQMVAANGDSVINLFEQLGVTTTTPSRVTARHEMTIALEAALSALPEDYAKVIRSYDLQGSTIAETAALVGRSPGAVHMLRTRAHARLRELLGQNPFLSVSA